MQWEGAPSRAGVRSRPLVDKDSLLAGEQRQAVVDEYDSIQTGICFFFSRLMYSKNILLLQK